MAIRLDRLLVERGLATSRERARELILAGKVLVDGIVAGKVGAMVLPERAITVASDEIAWVSRGAKKLLGVLGPLGVDPRGRICADLGASTGGFTEVLLHQGAERVYAIDVGHGQIAWKFRSDPRVVLMEGTNARHLEPLPDPIDLVVGDLSFISLALILPAVGRILAPNGEAVVLVKPQFEAGRAAIGKGGKVRSEEDRQTAITKVRADAEAAGFRVIGGMDSPVHGARAGNIEHFLHLRR